MAVGELSINDNIEVIYGEKYFKSNVQDINDTYISISVPTIKGDYILLSKNEKIDVVFSKGRGTYKFTSRVIGRSKEGNISVILITLPDDIEEYQRRMYVRVSIVSEVFCYHYRAHDKNILPEKITEYAANNNSLTFKGTMVDLSGGGMLIKVEEKVSLGDMLICRLDLKGSELVVCGEIIRLKRDEFNRYACGINFIGLSEKDRDRLFKYIFEVMRRHRGKALEEEY